VAATARRRREAGGERPVIEAVVFDLDGLLVDSEHLWDEVREELARRTGGRWHAGAQADMMGMSAPEWSAYMHDVIGVPMSPAEIDRAVVEGILERYGEGIPWLPGAREAVRRAARAWPLGLASSSNREVIDRVLDVGGLASCFRVTVSSEEVGAGKPAPDVFLVAAERLGVAAERCAAVEDSANGIRAALAAGMRTVAVPNARYPPPRQLLDRAAVVLGSLDELTEDALAG
jgi:HAD superfamily hydrolase (TIGR01509 family)